MQSCSIKLAAPALNCPRFSTFPISELIREAFRDFSAGRFSFVQVCSNSFSSNWSSSNQRQLGSIMSRLNLVRPWDDSRVQNALILPNISRLTAGGATRRCRAHSRFLLPAWPPCRQSSCSNKTGRLSRACARRWRWLPPNARRERAATVAPRTTSEACLIFLSKLFALMSGLSSFR
jgi:hypothetical protein